LQAVVLNEEALSAAAAQAYRVEFNCVAVRMLEWVFRVGGLSELAVGRQTARAAAGVFAGHPNAMDPAATLRLASARVANVVEAAQRDVGSPLAIPDTKLSTELAAWPGDWNISAGSARSLRTEMAAVDNPVGKWWAVRVFDSNLMYLDTISVARTRTRATAALLALRLYELCAGELPSTLTELVSAGILVMPVVDPHSGQALGYSKLMRTVWSIGSERGPNGGPSCGLGSHDCVWSLPDAFGDRTLLPHRPRTPDDPAAAQAVFSSSAR